MEAFSQPRLRRTYSSGFMGRIWAKAELAAKQRLDDRILVPWTDERTCSNASALDNIDRSPFATPAGQRSVSELAPDVRLPPAQAVASAATCDGMRSWQTGQGQTLSSLGSAMAKHHHKEEDPGFIPTA